MAVDPCTMDDAHVIEVSERRVWLLKVPQFLYDTWSEVTVPNVDLGSVVVENASKPGESPKISLMLNESPINQDIPKTYHMNFVKNPQSRYIFDEDPDGNALSIAGTIQYEFHVNPELDEDYRRIMKERNQQSSKPKRTVQVVDESKGSTRINILAPVNEYDLVHRSKRKLSPDSRRERLPKPELMDMIFRAFEREPYWSLKNLTEHTNQPSAYLREILSEIAVFNKRGPYKQMFQLKPEYTHKPMQ